MANPEHHYDTTAMELMQDDNGRVSGVRALTPTGFATFHAKAVVLACSGFEADAEMRTRYLGLSILVNVHGERFANESEDTRGKNDAKMGGAILRQPGGIAFQIMDAKIRKRSLYFQSTI